MKKTIILMSFLMMAFFSSQPSSHALVSLSPGQMKKAVAQAGVDIAIGDAVTETNLDSLRFSNPEDLNNQYISFNDINLISTLNTGSTDMNDDGYINHLCLDVGLYNNQVMFFAESPDLNLTTDISVGNIDFSGTVIGSLFVDKLKISSFHLFMGPHGSSGISFEAGTRLNINSIKYDYNSTDSLIFSGVTFSKSFSGTLENPDSWITEPGEFRVGDVLNNKVASLDFAGDTTANWNFVDSDGISYYVANPRNDKGYIAMNLPMEGSIRVKDISFGAENISLGITRTSLGSIAIDGIKVEKLYIEIPGRGLGNR